MRLRPQGHVYSQLQSVNTLGIAGFPHATALRSEEVHAAGICVMPAIWEEEVGVISPKNGPPALRVAI